MIYTAPTDGYYQVSVDIFRMELTGRFTLQENFNRRWWQFWKPKMVMKPEYVSTPIKAGGFEVKYLKEGEIVETNNIWKICP